MNIFDHLEYTEFIFEKIESKKTRNGRVNYSRLAAAVKIHRTYLTKIMRGDADFSEDQAYLASKFFDFNEEEQHYFILLVRFKRSHIKVRKEELKAENSDQRKLTTLEKIIQGKYTHSKASKVKHLLVIICS